MKAVGEVENLSRPTKDGLLTRVSSRERSQTKNGKMGENRSRDLNEWQKSREDEVGMLQI